MPVYDYKCRSCGNIQESIIANEPFECSCGGTYKRDFSSVQLPRSSPFQPHFNYSVGKYVNSKREFTNELRRAGEKQSERTGIEHSYVPLMPGDVPTPTRDDSVFETRNKVVRDTDQTHTYGEIS